MGRREGVESGAGFLTSQNDSHHSSEWLVLSAGHNQNMWGFMSTKTKLLTPGKCHMEQKFPRLLWKEEFPDSCPIYRLGQLFGQWDTLPLVLLYGPGMAECPEDTIPRPAGLFYWGITGQVLSREPTNKLSRSLSSLLFWQLVSGFLEVLPEIRGQEGRNLPWKRGVYDSMKLKIILVICITALLMFNQKRKQP